MDRQMQVFILSGVIIFICLENKLNAYSYHNLWNPYLFGLKWIRTWTINYIIRCFIWDEITYPYLTSTVFKMGAWTINHILQKQYM